jgi:hypothetical protein
VIGAISTVYEAPLPETVLALPLTTTKSPGAKPETDSLNVIVTENAD